MAGNCLRTATNEIVTTEWEDIQYKFGNKVGKYATQEEEIQRQKMKDMIEQAIDEYDPLENRNMDELNEMLEEDGLADEDEDAIQKYRRLRRQEMLEQQKGQRFDGIRHITKQEYVSEVSKAAEGVWVVCMLIEEGHVGCMQLMKAMADVAERNQTVKFVSIKSTDAVQNFPKGNLPCVLIYHSSELMKQLVGLQAWTEQGRNPSVESVEETLRIAGPLRSKRAKASSDSEEDSEQEEEERAPSAIGRQTRQSGKSKFSLM
eukprot:TRINITY_DN28790_c0_g1_i1.p1 TRINITY_DN28790_c0_g1~~TRINITY_DN28790_c0_g1_i1.p1  ORF type:complete len:261 (+),score=91.24 TRINITY_DN28790_c0_g1_i1:55-837(+)